MPAVRSSVEFPMGLRVIMPLHAGAWPELAALRRDTAQSRDRVRSIHCGHARRSDSGAGTCPHSASGLRTTLSTLRLSRTIVRQAWVPIGDIAFSGNYSSGLHDVGRDSLDHEPDRSPTTVVPSCGQAVENLLAGDLPISRDPLRSGLTSNMDAAFDAIAACVAILRF